MFRIDHSSAVAVKPEPKAAGTPGYFAPGDPATGTQATIMTDDWANLVQEELMAIVLDAGITPDKTNSGQVLAAMKAIFGTSPGKIEFYPSSAASPGFVKVNGALLSRTTYSRLWAYAQVSGNLAANDAAWQAGMFSPGDGVSTFRIPDMRGEFPRGWDDGRGVDAARALGSAQSHELFSHTHGATASTDGAHSHTVTYGIPGGGKAVTQDTGVYGDPTAVGTDAAGSHNHTITVNSAGGVETRPRNVALLACIKY